MPVKIAVAEGFAVSVGAVGRAVDSGVLVVETAGTVNSAVGLDVTEVAAADVAEDGGTPRES